MSITHLYLKRISRVMTSDVARQSSQEAGTTNRHQEPINYISIECPF